MTAVLFDLGNTLVAYYHREESRPILERSIANVVSELEARGIPAANRETLLARAVAADRERDDFRSSPMARLLGVPCEECVFVGDDPEWDVEGSRGVGMRPILIDHDGRHPGHAGLRVHRLAEVLPLVARPPA